MQSIGKSLQTLGLVVPPLTILAELNGGITAKQMLVFLLASVCLFGIGRIVEGYAGR